MSLRLHNSNVHFGLFISSSNEFAVILDVVVFQGTEITDEDLVGEALWPSGGLEIVEFYKKWAKNDSIPLRIPMGLVYLPTNLPLKISQI